MNPKVKDIELFEAFKAYTKEAITIIRKNAKKVTLLIEHENKWIHQDSHNFVREQSTNILWGIYILKFKSLLVSLNTFIKLNDLLDKKFVKRGKLDTLVGTYFSRTRISKESICNYILLQIIKEKNKIRFDINRFTCYFRKLELELYSDKIIVERITLLQGISIKNKTRRMKITHNVEIKELNKDEIVKILNLNILLINDFHGFISNFKLYALIVTYEVDKIYGDNSLKNKKNKAEYDYNFDNMILNLLHIYKSGNFIPLITFSMPNTMSHSGYTWKKLNIYNNLLIKECSLNQNEVNAFIKHYKNIDKENLNESTFHKIALSRFSQAVERDRIEDKIIDLVISAEALFLNDIGSKGELNYRFALRASYLIAKSAAERKKIFKYMKNFYDIRSKIVHGEENKIKLPYKDTEKKEKYELKEFYYLIEEYIRNALMIYIKSCYYFSSKINKIEWDDMILK